MEDQVLSILEVFVTFELVHPSHYGSIRIKGVEFSVMLDQKGTYHHITFLITSYGNSTILDVTLCPLSSKVGLACVRSAQTRTV